MSRQKLKNIANIFTLTIKTLCSTTSIFVILDIPFYVFKTILEFSSRTNVLFKTVLTGYRTDNINTIKMKDSRGGSRL